MTAMHQSRQPPQICQHHHRIHHFWSPSSRCQHHHRIWTSRHHEPPSPFATAARLHTPCSHGHYEFFFLRVQHPETRVPTTTTLHVQHLHFLSIIFSAAAAKEPPHHRSPSIDAPAATTASFPVTIETSSFMPAPVKPPCSSLRTALSWEKNGEASRTITTVNEAPIRASITAVSRSHHAFSAGAAPVRAAKGVHETLNAANPSLERESALCTTCQAAIGQSNWSTLVNWSKSAVNSSQNCKNG